MNIARPRHCMVSPRVLLGLLLAALTMVAAGCPLTTPQDTPVSEFRADDPVSGADYYLYVPSSYKTEYSYPLVVTLHGTYGFDDALRQAKEWKALAEDHQFIVLAPKLASTQGVLPVGQSSRLKDLQEDEARVLSMLARVREQYNINPNAIMLTGFSAGGYPLFYVGLRHPEQFSLLVARTCSSDMAIIKEIPITDAAKALPILIYYSKAGINPASTHLNPVAEQSWAAFEHLRRNGCRRARISSIEGGHRRAPERAMDFWKELQPDLWYAKP